MKKNNKIKILFTIICIIVIFLNTVNVTNVTFAADSNMNQIYNKNMDEDLKSAVGEVLGVVQAVGYISALIMLTFKGIQYIYSSPEGKAEIKKHFLPYFIGMLILASGASIAAIIAKTAYNS